METRNLLACCLLVAACITTVAAQGYSTLPPGVTGGPFWRILCPNQALFSGFADPIVTPGNYSSHVHRVFGASRFGFGASPVDTVAYYNYILESECTQCNIIADKSLYWVPELYYMYPNGSLTLVPDGGLTIYYLSRGTGPWTAIPPGLRMTAGSPTRRSFDPTQDSNLAVSYVCIGAPDGYNPKYNSQPPYFPTNETVCSSVRGQIWFPNCWNGTFLDSANHQSHMSYPLDGPGGGNCPPDFPIKFPGVFYEINFPTPVATFPHGPGAQGKFVFSTGDATGESLHGDFINGWDVNVLQNALDDISCYASPTNGGSVNSCNTLVPYINPTSDCQLEQPLPTIIDYGYNHLIGRVPGCNNPVTLVEGPIVPDCFDIQPENPVYNGVLRVVLKSVSNGQFLSLWNFTTPVTANAGTDIYNLSYSSVFLLFPNPVGAPAGLYSIYNEQSLQYCTASVGGTTGFMCNKNSPSGWEFFSLNFNADRSVVSILANSNNKTLSLQSNGQYYNNAGTVTATEQFMVYDANAVAVVRPPQQVVPGSSNPGSTTGASSYPTPPPAGLPTSTPAPPVNGPTGGNTIGNPELTSSASSVVAAASVVGLAAIVVAAAAM